MQNNLYATLVWTDYHYSWGSNNKNAEHSKKATK